MELAQKTFGIFLPPFNKIEIILSVNALENFQSENGTFRAAEEPVEEPVEEPIGNEEPVSDEDLDAETFEF